MTNKFWPDMPKGLIGLSACLKGEIPTLSGRATLKRRMRRQNFCGPAWRRTIFFWRLRITAFRDQEIVNRGLLDMHHRLGIPWWPPMTAII
ncbi:MAG: hypothetical protein R2860_11955 [Desulfobacterales bacterium]